MDKMKTCKQCGDMKPIAQFRRYYGGRKGSYNTCKACESINNRYKYLNSKDPSTLDTKEEADLLKIEQLWGAQRRLGLQPPRIGQGKQQPKDNSLDDMLARYVKSAEESEVQQFHNAGYPIPKELTDWLNGDLTQEPEYYLDEVYEDLKKRYRPILRVDGETMLPVYDETYKLTLDQILTKFYDYEDEYESAH